MRKIFLISILWILPINAFAAGWNNCLTYAFSCDEESNTLKITRDLEECSYIGSLFYTPDEGPLVKITPADLLKKERYLPTNATYDGPRSHSCTLGEHSIKVEMSHIEVPTDSSFNYFCWGANYAYIMVINAWSGGKKIVDNLYFNGTCDKEKNIPGNLFYAFDIKVLEHTSNILFDALTFENGEDKHRTFVLSTDASSAPKEKTANNTKTLTTPLKNIHIHDHDMQYEFWDPHEERAEIVRKAKEYEESKEYKDLLKKWDEKQKLKREMQKNNTSTPHK